KYHFVATADDVIIHDGVTQKSVCNRRMRRTVFNQIDINAFAACFVFSVPNQREMWFVYPESGASNVTRALIWRYGDNGDGVLSESEFAFNSATLGDTPTVAETWDTDTSLWSTTTDIWDTSAKRKVVLADAVGKQLLQMDLTTQRDGNAFTAT